MDSITRFKETLGLNAKSGDIYVVIFKNNPIPYVGIPKASTTDEDQFVFRILEPEDKEGIYTFSYDEIESLKKRYA
jgi:hypothetical protein